MQVFESILSSSQRGLGKNPEWTHGVAREKELGLQIEVLSHFLPPTIWGTLDK